MLDEISSSIFLCCFRNKHTKKAPLFKGELAPKVTEGFKRDETASGLKTLPPLTRSPSPLKRGGKTLLTFVFYGFSYC